MNVPLYGTETGHAVLGESGMPVEFEAMQFLYGIVRYAKPSLIVECGTGSGASTQALLHGVRENGRGSIYTYEPHGEFYGQAVEAFKDAYEVVVKQGTSIDCDLRPDFVFVDTGGGAEVRNPIIEKWLTASWRPLVVVHDGNRNYEAFKLGEGVNIPGWDGIWIGRGK